MNKPKIEHISVSVLIPYARNSRTHSDAQVSQIAGSIREFGFTNPVLIDSENGIIAGHGRVMAAQKLGLTEVPCIRLDHLTETQRKAYVIADNKLALNSGWDEDMLKLELSELQELGEFDLSLIGFSEDELAALLAEVTVEGNTDPDEVPEIPINPVSVVGDTWRCGSHVVACGSSTVATDLTRLMGNDQADLAVTDPPWNTDYEEKSAHVNGENKGRGILNDKMNDGDWAQFVNDFCGSLAMSVKDGAPIYVVMSGQEWPRIDDGLRTNGFHWSATIVWVKESFVITRRDYHARYEPIWYGWKEGAARLKPLATRNQDDVWELPRPKTSDIHPMMKPVELVMKAIENSSNKGDVVVDLFGGSGTTLMACERTGRTARIMELDPKYADAIVMRWQDFTGKQAVHAETGKTFDEMKSERDSK
jgi:DNA modification methylase